MSDRIKTYVRLRPSDPNNLSSFIQTRSNSVIIDKNIFSFDYVGDNNTSQKEVFEAVGIPLCDHALEGFNVALFCYGQTGSGKTWTMQGPTGTELETISASTTSYNNEERGLIQRTFEYIFEKQNEQKLIEPEREYLNKVTSFVEIYNEQIYDLLDPSMPPCTLREDLKRGGIFIAGATEQCIISSGDAQKLLEIGSSNRRTASTEMNTRSSRSHSILTLTIQTKTSSNGITSIKESRVNLVDLAGSERQKSANTDGQRLKEGSHINKSLLTLGTCINALVDVSNGKPRHVHYRDSKLTLLLKDSLGGNSKSTMIATVSSNPLSLSESISTLRFAQRAKMVKNKAHINQLLEANSLLQLQEEIKRLQVKLEEAESKVTDSSKLVSSQTSANRKFEFELLKNLSFNFEKEKKVNEELQAEVFMQRQKYSNLKMLFRLKSEEVKRLKEGKSDEDAVRQLHSEIAILGVIIEECEKDVSKIRLLQKRLAEQYESQSHIQDELRCYKKMEMDWCLKILEFENERKEFEKLIFNERKVFEAEILKSENKEYFISLTTKIESLINEVQSLKLENKQISSHIEKELDEKISILAELEEVKDQVLYLENVRAEQQEEVKLLKKKVVDFNVQLENNEVSPSTVQNQIIKANEENQFLVAQIKILEDNIKKFERSERKSRRISDFAVEKEDHLHIKIKDLEQANEQLTNIIEENNNTFNVLHISNEKLNNDLNKLQNELFKSRELLNTSSLENENLLSKNQAMQNEIECLTQTASVLEERMTKISKEYSVSAQEKKYLETCDNVQIKDLENRLIMEQSKQKIMEADYSKRIQILVEKLNEDKKQIADFEIQAEDLREKLTDYEEMERYVEIVEKKISHNQSNMEKMNLKFEKVSGLLEDAKLTNFNLSILLEAATNEKIQQDKLQVEYKKLQLDNSLLEENIAALITLREEDKKKFEELHNKLLKPASKTVQLSTDDLIEDKKERLVETSDVSTFTSSKHSTYMQTSNITDIFERTKNDDIILNLQLENSKLEKKIITQEAEKLSLLSDLKTLKNSEKVIEEGKLLITSNLINLQKERKEGPNQSLDLHQLNTPEILVYCAKELESIQEDFLLRDQELKKLQLSNEKLTFSNEKLLKSNPNAKIQYVTQLKQESNVLKSENRLIKDELKNLKKKQVCINCCKNIEKENSSFQ
ncbi:Kinesin-like protein kif15 [Lobulomyces angularis]|nr:Kinesin-like protein kif15 [Lobulomyces angularis]